MSDIALSPGRAELLVQSVTDYAIYMLDREGIVCTWNAGAERLKRYAAEEIIGQHFSRFYTPEDLETGLPARALNTALGEGRFEAEGWRLRKDGTRFWANVVIDAIRDETGEHVGFAKVTRDLTERREAEEALRRSEERFRLLVEGVTDYAIYMLSTAGHVTSWNAGAERFKGYVAAEIIGEHFSRFYLPEDRAAGKPERALETAQEEGRFEAEGWRMRKDGSRFWANVVIDAIRDNDGKLIGFTKITRDLTERKLTQEALKLSQERLFQSQKMESIGQLTGGVAHDFNNILAAIMGSLNLAQRRLGEGEDIARFLSNAMLAAQRGAMLTQRMLSFARKQELKLEPVDVIGCVRDMAELLGRTIGPGVTITTRFPLTLRPAMADRSQLELALMNLVVNARDALPNGGTIEVSAAEVESGDSEHPGKFVRLRVEDDGEGMAGEVLAKAIEPFFTTKGVGKGTGLGLPMVHGMAQQCGGSFTLVSEPGTGTVAEILLPAAEDHGLPIGPTLRRAVATRPLRILAVDDDAIVLLNTATMLADMGHDVLQAPSASAALAIVEEQPIDLVIADFAMPRIDGAELVARAQALRPGLRAIIVSGYADVPEGLALTAPRLSKPFTDTDLADKIAEICC